jgi:hypothetical protein
MGTDDNGYELAICSSSADEQEVRFAMDSSLEEAGFELVVPL